MKVKQTKNLIVKKTNQVFFLFVLFFSNNLWAQTNVYDDIIAISPNHTYLKAAIDQQNLQSALRDSTSNLTVFAPTNAAFDSLAAALNTDIPGILALSNLTDILTYHVLGTSVASSAITNGQIVTPLFNGNTLKLTKTTSGNVFINQAQVTTADVNADNGVVHVLNAVVLPNETVADIALDDPTNFSTLVAAVVKAELLPALTNPFSSLTVFAPTNSAFNNLATSLNTDLNGILALPNLEDVLLYHVLGNETLSTELTAGNVLALNGKNLTVSISPTVKINDADVTTADVIAENGVVHVINKVLVPSNNTNIESINSKQLTLYPNPSCSSISVDIINNVKYEIVNMYGVTVQQGEIINGFISIGLLSHGKYIVKVKNDETLFIGNFIKL